MTPSQLLSPCLTPCLGRHSQDASQDIAPADLIELRDPEQQLLRPGLLRHSLPAQGLRYRSEACRLPQTAQPASGAGLSGVAPDPLQRIAKANDYASDYASLHRLHIQKRLQHRIAVAMAKGDQPLVNLLQRELKQAS